MSTETRANKLALILAAVVVGVVLLLGVRSCTTPSTPRESTSVQPGRPADADGVDATLRTMTARLGEVADLGQRQATQEQRLAQLEGQLVAESPKALEAQVNELAVILRELQNTQLALTDRLAAVEADRTQPLPSGAGHGIPPEFGIGPGARPADAGGGFDLSYPIGVSTPATDTWVYPLDHRELDAGAASAGAIAASGVGVAMVDSGVQSPSNSVATAQPRFTVPVNATMLDARAMTALIGRIPVQGQLQDPYPVKVVVGPEGLASNGLTLPSDLRGVVFSGAARGDWGLGCVRVQLSSATFTFDDGTIRTLSTEGEEEALGYISDAAGNPCIDGERISNAPKVLAARFAAGAFEAAARGFAQAQTNQVVTGGGSVVTAIDDAARFGAYTGLAGGAEDAQDWLEARLAQSFDAVYAPPGAVVAVHIQQALEIDYEPDGRKLIHEQDRTAQAGVLD